MLITYFRSSSYNEWGLCQQQYFLDYVLGIPQDSNKKAEMGTIFHKVMECLARANMAVRDWQPGELRLFTDTQLGPIPVDDKTLHTPQFVDRVFNAVYTHYTFPGASIHTFTQSDKRTIYGWVCNTLEKYNGLFDPRKRDIVATEPHFDFAIEEPWAHYEFLDPITNQPIEGQLHIKGTVDLITRVQPDMYEIVDWKSGQRKDWGTGQEKDFNKLSIDPQLRMYHYAVHRMYPDVKQIVMTINFVRPDQGGPFTMAYGPEDQAATLEMLRERFEKIKASTRPTLRSPNCSDWFCTRVCSYGKNRHPKDPTKNICQYIKQKIIKVGINEVIRSETATNHHVGNYSNPGE
jgi:hypothetical protein